MLISVMQSKNSGRIKVMKLNLEKTGLVLEGGGMRGVFTSGVLAHLALQLPERSRDKPLR